MRLLGVVLAVLFLAACAEREQVADAERSYQGKRDTQAWDNAPLDYAASLNYGGQWSKGDRASWEKHTRERQLTQNEYGRMER
jgi:hypothetical protein